MKKGSSFLVTIVLAAGLGACGPAGLRTPSVEAPAAATVTQPADFNRQPICRWRLLCAV